MSAKTSAHDALDKALDSQYKIGKAHGYADGVRAEKAYRIEDRDMYDRQVKSLHGKIRTYRNAFTATAMVLVAFVGLDMWMYFNG